MAVGLCLIAWRLKLWYLMAAAGILFLAGLVSTLLLEKITAGWMWIGEKMGAVMSRVILTFVFIFIVTPLAVAYRLFGKKKIENAQSHFVERNHTYTAADLEKVF